MVKGVRTRLQLRRNVFSVNLRAVKLNMAVTVQNDAAIRIGIEALAPEIESEIPFRSVKLRSVEFICPDKLPFPVGQITRFVIFNFKLFHRYNRTFLCVSYILYTVTGYPNRQSSNITVIFLTRMDLTRSPSGLG